MSQPPSNLIFSHIVYMMSIRDLAELMSYVIDKKLYIDLFHSSHSDQPFYFSKLLRVGNII